jgi:hypothetical protein
MSSEKRKRNFFPKIYLYIFALGLMLFGTFAILYPSYNHPIYGHINLGEYHIYIGAVSLLLSIVLMRYIKKRY